ncbi:ATP-binding cassette domain-containing protein [Exiguobacterium sp. TDN 0502]|uniref:ATP-binding cassette domain-containing protein n=1 Tax=Exiguobacterium sp. TDN 0502 TaxID=3420731 RepID=UPI003D77F315
MSLLQIDHVSHVYKRRFRPAQTVLHDVSLTLEAGQCLGLLGSSGAGKSTLGRLLLGLERPSSGTVWFNGVDRHATKRPFQGDVQVVFQDSFAAVNPKLTAADIIAEPLDNFIRLKGEARQQRLVTLIEQVGLKATDLTKYPSQFSGGQLQRIAIARAIAAEPRLIVLDEAVSSLDMVNKRLILELLADLKRKHGLTYVFITHDIKAAEQLCDSFAILEQGRLVGHYPGLVAFDAATDLAVERMRQAKLAVHPRQRTIRKTQANKG